MPLYEFKCPICCTTKDKIVKSDVKRISCVSETCNGTMERKIGSPRFRMEGDGFYKSKAGLQ